jgi:hypothetical protein
MPQGLEIRHKEIWNCSLIDKSIPAVVDAAWSVQEGPAGGSITGDGVYTAPAANGVYHVIATLKTDASKTFTIPVTVGDGLTLSGDPGSSRIGHSAALLPNGHVLISGGTEYSAAYYQSIDRIDEYDPVTGIYTYVNSLKRIEDSVTVLANGDVLFAGGRSWARDASGELTLNDTAGTQILRTRTGALESSGAMNLPRVGHTATLLQDGRVLIAGGWLSSQGLSTATAEVYNPVTGGFASVGSMSVGHVGHSATLLQNGQVLISGDGPVELFDPAANTFTVVGAVPNGAYRSVATLLKDGRVLITGGSVGSDIYVAYLKHEAYLYDPGSRQFTLAGEMTVAREFPTATLLPDGAVLIAGGDTRPDYDNDYMDGGMTDSTEIFHPNSFTVGPTLTRPRSEHTATLLPDGSVLVVGGLISGSGDRTEIVH